MQAKHESEVLRFRRGKKMQLDIFAGRAPAREPSASGLIVDSFAGGGGASLGIEMALGRGPDIAINHDPEAIAMHAVNHPSARHYIENVWKVDPLEATAGKPVSLLWASPNCTHFSKAKGGRPVDNGIRGLAWVVIRWAKTVRPKTSRSTARTARNRSMPVSRGMRMSETMTSKPSSWIALSAAVAFVTSTMSRSADRRTRWFALSKSSSSSTSSTRVLSKAGATDSVISPPRRVAAPRASVGQRQTNCEETPSRESTAPWI